MGLKQILRWKAHEILSIGVENNVLTQCKHVSECIVGVEETSLLNRFLTLS